MSDFSVTRQALLPLVIAASVSGLGAAPSLAADPPAIVEALRTNACNPPQTRASFAKGVCVRGTYAPSKVGATVTRSVSFNTPFVFIGRFSVGGGSPKITDTTKTVLRGFSIKLQSAEGGTAQFDFQVAG